MYIVPPGIALHVIPPTLERPAKRKTEFSETARAKVGGMTCRAMLGDFRIETQFSISETACWPKRQTGERDTLGEAQRQSAKATKRRNGI